jgi:hypothetical protein
MMDESHGDEEVRRHRRGLKFRRREDHAVELFGEALAKLDDPVRVARILLELGRYYNPYVNAPIVDAATRRAILESLESNDVEAARTLIQARLAAYARPEEDPGTTSGP